MRSALVGVIAGVIGVVGCFTFRAGLVDTANTPSRAGIVWDYVVAAEPGPLPNDVTTTIKDDRGVGSAMRAQWARAISIDGVPTPTFGTSVVKGSMSLVVLQGHAPRSPDEIAFGPATLRELKVHLGDRVTVGAAGHRARVVGTALLPATSHTDYDHSAWMTGAGLRTALGPEGTDITDYTLIRWRNDVAGAAASERLSRLADGQSVFAMPAELPSSVVELGKLRSLPIALIIFFALLAIATVGHALVTTVRRRRHDLAILRSIGFTRRQARLAITWQATLLTIVGLVVGIPLGIVCGRLLWRWLADSFPVAYVPPLALVAMLIVIPIAIVLASVLAAPPPTRLLGSVPRRRCGRSSDGATPGIAERECGLHERGVGQRLRVVAEMVAGGGIHLLGVEAERARELDERGESIGGFGDPAGAGERLDEPERAGQERAFGAGEPVASGRVAVEERAAGVELAADRVDRAADARRVGRFDAEEREDEERGVEVVGLVAARCSSPRAALKPRRSHVVGDGVALGVPALAAPLADSGECSAMRSARSSASQAMSLECTWCCASPRISQMPASGSRHCCATWSANPAMRPPRLGVQAVAGLRRAATRRRGPSRSCRVDAGRRRRSDPDGSAVGVAGPVVERRVRRAGACRAGSAARGAAAGRAGWRAGARRGTCVLRRCLPTPRNAPTPMLASRGQAKR